MRKRAEERRMAKLQEEQVRLFQPTGQTSWLATSVPLAKLPRTAALCYCSLQERLCKLTPGQRLNKGTS